MKKKQKTMIIAGATIAIFIWVGSYFAVGLVKKMVLHELKNKFIQTQQTFKTVQNLRYNRLVESAYLLAENSTFKANLELGDPATITYSVNEFSPFMRIDLFAVFDKKGMVLAQMANNMFPAKDLSQHKNIAATLAGKEPNTSIDWPKLLYLNHNIYQIVSVPVYKGSQNIIGTIMLGTKFTDIEIKELQQNHPFQINIFHKNKLILSSTKLEDEKALTGFLEQYSTEVEKTLRDLKPSSLLQGRMGTAKTFAFVSPLGKNESALYVCSISEQEVMKSTASFQLYIYGFAFLLSVIIGSILLMVIKKGY